MKKLLTVLLSLALVFSFSACTGSNTNKDDTNGTNENNVIGTNIVLSDSGITADGEAVTDDDTKDIYIANDIVFYLEGQGFTYGAGESEDEHSQAEADAHTVLHITAPGTYTLSGKLSAGQIAIDLGEDAADDPEAVVTLVLNGVDITCTVAPGIIFYNVYECGPSDEENATKDVDTSAAGANIIIADGTENTVNGSYVAKIYKSYTLNAEGTEVEDSKKLHKYDGAVYSKMSMNVNGGEEGTGVLNINAENEGLDSELHLTINGGTINITAGNDGINTNEDGVSVTTVNGGTLNILVTGTTGEGDGIDSNGWLIINGGSVISQACSSSGDAGIDSDNGIYINGGTVIATGNMLDAIAGAEQNYAVFTVSGRVNGGDYTIRNADGDEIASFTLTNSFTYLIFSSPELEEGELKLMSGDTQIGTAQASTTGMMQGPGFGGGPGMHGGGAGFGGEFDPENMPEGAQGRPERPEGGPGFGGDFDPDNMPEGEDGRPEKPDGEPGFGGEFDPDNMPEGEKGGPGSGGENDAETEDKANV